MNLTSDILSARHDYDSIFRIGNFEIFENLQTLENRSNWCITGTWYIFFFLYLTKGPKFDFGHVNCVTRWEMKMHLLAWTLFYWLRGWIFRNPFLVDVYFKFCIPNITFAFYIIFRRYDSYYYLLILLLKLKVSYLIPWTLFKL